MPATINSLHAALTLIAAGILFGLGFHLIALAIQWPAGRVAAGAGVICVLLLALAWLVP